jgi:hypothetical protein
MMVQRNYNKKETFPIKLNSLLDQHNNVITSFFVTRHQILTALYFYLGWLDAPDSLDNLDNAKINLICIVLGPL